MPLLIPGVGHREDDIVVSLCISGGRKDWHRVPARLKKRWKNLSEHGVSMTREPGHYQHRWAVYQKVNAYVAKNSIPRFKSIISDLRRGSCWCGKGIGNPMLKTHTDACAVAQEAMSDG